MVAERLGIRLIEDPEYRLEGAYDYNEARITVNPTIWPDRLEFTFYHEVTHHLLEIDKNLISDLDATGADYRSQDRAKEFACDVGAAEFLIPHRRLRELTVDKEWDGDLLRCVHKSFSASWVACVLQLAVVAPHACLGVVCKPDVTSAFAAESFWPDSARTVSNLVVIHSMPSESMKYPLARGTPIPSDHLFRYCFDDGSDYKDRSYIPFRSGKRMQCDCVAIRVGPVVLGMLHVSSPPPVGQLTLDDLLCGTEGF